MKAGHYLDEAGLDAILSELQENMEVRRYLIVYTVTELNLNFIHS